LQTPVYALYPIPTIACAALHLAVRHAGIPLPGDSPAKPSEIRVEESTSQTEDPQLSREQELRRALELRQQQREEDQPWYTLFDVDREDLEAVSGWIMRLYQQRDSKLEKTVLELVVGGKKAVRAWADEQS
ncbi:hypothetical protein FS749_005722, partial [Ceratobasidium sp. UAMH 11750]